MKNPKWFDYAKEATEIANGLGEDQHAFKVQISNAIKGASTGGEALFMLRGLMIQLLEDRDHVSSTIEARARNFVGMASDLLG